MADVRRCPQCGADLPAAAPDQPCPACLMKLGLASWAAAGDPAHTPTQLSPGEFDAPTVEELAGRLPQFDVLELIGKGGMGAVYKARQKSLDRIVALKIINPRAAEDPSFAERFAREARSLARLNHPHIVTVHDFGAGRTSDSVVSPGTPDPGRPGGPAGALYYLVMEYVDGTNVRDLLRNGALQPQQALAIVPPLCDALQYAHDEGIVHRDIKPENILVDRTGRVKIADFGLAKLLGRGLADVTLTAAHQTLGTLHYMAPEQLERPRDVDHRADIYSLGVTFYEMLTGELPLGRFAPPSHMVRVDVRLDDVVLKALEKEPARRYQHASDVKSAVETIAIEPRGVPRPASHEIVTNEHHEVHERIVALLQAGRLVQAIRAYRQATGADLDSARYAVETIARSHRLPIPKRTARQRALDVAVFSVALLAAVGTTSVLPVSQFVKTATLIGASTVYCLLLVATWIGIRQDNSDPEKTHAHLTQPVPLVAGAGPRLLALALGFVFSSLVMVAGGAMVVWALLRLDQDAGAWGGLIGGGIGTLIGGAGGVFGTWNNYRKFRGATDFMQEPQWNGLDTAMGVYGLLGVGVLLATWAAWTSSSDVARLTALLLGTMAVFQAGAISLWRLAVRQAAQCRGEGPRLDARMFVIAGSMILCGLLMAAGIAMGVLAFVNVPLGSAQFWGVMGGAVGCVFGGGGGLLGTWNSYRTLEGGTDLMLEGHWNLMDRCMLATAGIGATLLIGAATASLWASRATVHGGLLIGGILTFQSAIFLVIRALMRRGAKQEAGTATSEPAR